jgi:hypothetical protein
VESILNTTSGPKQIQKGTREPVINTSRVVEEDMQYLDEEPEIISVIPARGWHALIDVGESLQPVRLVAFVALDTGRMYGVALDGERHIDLVEGDVEKRPGFARYEQTTNDKEN